MTAVIVISVIGIMIGCSALILSVAEERRREARRCRNKATFACRACRDRQLERYCEIVTDAKYAPAFCPYDGTPRCCWRPAK